MTDNRTPMTRAFRLGALVALALASSGLAAQSPPRRLELADSARNAPRSEPRPAPALETLRAAIGTAPAGRGTSTVGAAFVRDQALLGALVYGPSFAATVTNDPVAWIAAYLVVGGGTYFAAAELARDLTITGPAGWFATQTALRGGLAGWAVAHAANGSRHERAGGIFFGSLAGTTAALVMGRGMHEGEVAGATFGADLMALAGLAATHIADGAAGSRTRAGTMAAGALLGYPLGYWYASRAPYRVTAGDVVTLWSSAAIGATAAGAVIASGDPSARVVAFTLAGGAMAGVLFGDLLLVRPVDHSPLEGQLVALGATGGGLMGAGIAMLSGAARERASSATAALTAAGAIGGVMLAERWLKPRGDEGRRVARLELNPLGALAAAAGVHGDHPLLRWTF